MAHPPEVSVPEEITEVSRKAVRSPTNSGVPRLILLSGPQAGRKFPVAAEMTLGRGSQATVFLDDKRLSRLHARIFSADSNTYVVEDLKSLNGSFVNGNRIGQHVLSYGDKIQVGASTLLFTHDNPLDEQLAQMQKMEMLGRVGAGIAHDFNNLLGVAVASMDYIATLPGDRTLGEADIRECHEDIRSALKRAAELTMRLLGVARRGGYVMARLDVGNLAREVAELVRRVTPQNVQIECDLQAETPVIGDQGQIHQALMNLCLNARDAMSGGGILKVAVRRENSQGAAAVLGEAVLVSVSDTGVGMDEKTRRRAFESFFTTKEGSRGTGLGLATVLETVKVHGGYVDLQSQLGQGTTVRLFFPAAPRVDKSRIGTQTLTDLPIRNVRQPQGLVRVLLVDDDEGVRRSLSRVLAMQGHEVEQAANGQLALDAYRTVRPDVVLMDLDMPVLSGRQAYDRLITLDPKAKVIFMSGHGGSGTAGGPPPGCSFLQKPCGAADLRSAIAAAVATAAPAP